MSDVAHPSIRSDKAASLPVIFLGILGAIQMSDPMVANLALVKATKALSFSPSMQALAASISTLALAATVVPSGVVADKIGRRKMLVIALLLAALGDVIAAIAPAAPVFLLGRAITGVGLGAVFACSFGIVRSVTTDRAFPPALGIFAAMCSVPLFIFMPLGSALAGVSWRAAFLMIPVVAVIGALLCFKILPNLPPVASAKKEYWGLVALGVGVVALLIGVSSLAKSLTSPNTLVPLAVGVLAMVAFIQIEKRAKNPTYPLSLFKSPLFLVGALGGFAWNAASAVGQLLSSNLWQYVDGFTPFKASIYQMPIMVFSIVASVLAGRVIGKGRSAVGVLVVGGVLTAVGLVAAGLTASQSQSLIFLAAFCVAFFGCGVMTVPQSQMFVQESPPEFYGPVTSSRTCVGQLAYAIGLAGGAAIASSITASRLISDAGLSTEAASEEVGKFITGGKTSVADITSYYTAGFSMAMYAFAVLVGLCTVVILILGRKASARSKEHGAVDASNAAAAAA